MNLTFPPANPANKGGGDFSAFLEAQLDHLYDLKNDRLTLFWAPTEDPEYRPGFSWLELLGTQITQIKRACRRFCTTFESPESYADASDKFQGKPYCCVEINEAGKLVYYRQEVAR